MKYLILTDSHLGHNMLSEKGYRKKSFSEDILNNIKKIQGKEKIIFIHLGDMWIGNDKYWAEQLKLATLGFYRKIIVKGNHDNKSNKWYYEHTGFDFICDKFELRFRKKNLLFSHIPVLKSETKDIYKNIHGHLHGASFGSHRAIDGYDSEFNYDCAPDNTNMQPVYLHNII